MTMFNTHQDQIKDTGMTQLIKDNGLKSSLKAAETVDPNKLSWRNVYQNGFATFGIS